MLPVKLRIHQFAETQTLVMRETPSALFHVTQQNKPAFLSVSCIPKLGLEYQTPGSLSAFPNCVQSIKILMISNMNRCSY